MSASQPQSDDAASTGAAWGTSVLFWVSMFFAAGLYGVVALSPKLLATMKLDREYYNNQVELVRLERQVQYLERVTQAFQSDPEFAAEVAGFEFNATRQGEQQILVDERLTLAPAAAEPELPPLRVMPWYAPMLEQLATGSALRTFLLCGAGAITLMAFGFMHDGRDEHGQAIGIKAILRSRYREPATRTKRRAA